MWQGGGFMERSIQVRAIQGRPVAAWGDAIAIPVIKGKNAARSSAFGQVDKAMRGALSDLIGSGDFSGAADEVRVLYYRG